MLASEEAGERKQAAYALFKLAPAVPDLIHALCSEDAVVRARGDAGQTAKIAM